MKKRGAIITKKKDIHKRKYLANITKSKYTKFSYLVLRQKC